MQILFCIDEARKRSFTEVALNSVLEENAASAIDFEWEFYSPNKNIYEQCICCVSQLFHRRFNPGTLRIARSAVHTLRSVRKQTRVRFLNSCAEWGSLTIPPLKKLLIVEIRLLILSVFHVILPY